MIEGYSSVSSVVDEQVQSLNMVTAAGRSLSLSKLQFCPKRLVRWNRCRQTNRNHRCMSTDAAAQHMPMAEVQGPTNNDTSSGLADAIRPQFDNKTPMVFRGACQSMPAFQKWSDSSYFPETLPPSETGAVEIGGSYSSGQTDRAEIPIQDYLQYLKLFEERHGRQGSAENPWERPASISSDELVYMAQNDLPRALYPDIEIPAFCCQEEDTHQVGHGRLYSVMWWLGPRACVSPLHFDPLDNLLMQFVGRKVVWLLDPNPGGMWHYAGHDGQQANTSPVNPEAVDTARYPRFLQEGPVAQRCVLHPGDMLYIPSKWWHYVRSVDTSVSVNVWWR